MFSGRSLSQKICRQGQKNVFGRIVPANNQKFLIIFYGLFKMAQGCQPLASAPEPTRTPMKTIFSNRWNYTQCFNIPLSQQFALVIRQPLPQLNLTVSNKFVAVVFNKHLHNLDQYADMLETKIERMEFANKIRIQLFLVKTIKGDIGRILIALAILAIFCKIFGYKGAIWYVHCATSAGSYTDNSARPTQHPPIYQIQNSLQLAIFWIQRKAIQRNGSSTHQCNHSTTAIGNSTTNNYDNQTTHFSNKG
jgi:hypothetical protein